MNTHADFWKTQHDHATWRTCRKQFVCHYRHTSYQPLCTNIVKPGDRYFDTGELVDWPVTMRICSECATKIMDH